MGSRELKDAFNEVSAPTAVCQKALLEYLPGQGTEWQILYFSGNYADGAGFSIKSDRLRPGTDVNAAARVTAEQLLQRKRV